MKTKLLLFIAIIFCSAASAQSYYENYFQGLSHKYYAEYQLATEYFTKAVLENGINYDAVYERGKCYIALKEYNKAIDDFKFCEAVFPEKSRIEISKSYALLNDNKSAIKYLEKHLLLPNKLAQNIIKSDSCFCNLQNTQEWVNLWKKEHYSMQEQNMEEINYLISKNKKDEALQLINSELQKQKNNYKIMELQTKILIENKDYKNALLNCNYLIEKNKNNSISYQLRSQVFSLQSKENEAISDITKAMELNNKNIDLFKQRGLLYYADKQYDNALQDLELYTGYFTRDDSVLFICGKIYAQKNDYLPALQYLNKTLKSNQTNIDYFITRATIFYELKSYPEAINDFSMALDLNPRLSVIYYQRGLARLQNGNVESAVSDWQKAKKLGYLQADNLLKQYGKTD